MRADQDHWDHAEKGPTGSMMASSSSSSTTDFRWTNLQPDAFMTPGWTVMVSFAEKRFLEMHSGPHPLDLNSCLSLSDTTYLPSCKPDKALMPFHGTVDLLIRSKWNDLVPWIRLLKCPGSQQVQPHQVIVIQLICDASKCWHLGTCGLRCKAFAQLPAQSNLRSTRCIILLSTTTPTTCL